MLDLVEALRASNAGREPERLAKKWEAMQSSPFVFFRGACGLFYQRLPQSSLPPVAPKAWLCGDLHLENFGCYKGDNRLVYFDINDFDEAALGPVTWDLVRLLASTLVAARALRIKRAEAIRMCHAMLAGYGDALQAGRVGWVERDAAPGMIQGLCSELQQRKRVDLLDRYTEPGKRRRAIRVDGKRALKASRGQRAHAEALVAAAVPKKSPSGFFEVLDVARRVSGTGNLGLERWVVLLQGKGSPDRNYLLDVKQAVPSALERPLGTPQPAWASQAHRVVALQSRLQAMPAAFLHPAVKGDRSYVLRGLQPSDDKVALEASRASFEHIGGVAGELGRLVAWAQLRSAGRQGSDAADDLIVFGSARSTWQAPLLEAASICAEQTRDDWKAFVRAYKRGAFK